MQRLLGEVFLYGFPEFRQYCEDEPDWQVLVSFRRRRCGLLQPANAAAAAARRWLLPS